MHGYRNPCNTLYEVFGVPDRFKILSFRLCQVVGHKRLISYFSKYWNRQALSNSVDIDQTSQTMAFDQGLYCLPLTQQFLGTSIGSGSDLFKLLHKYGKPGRRTDKCRESILISSF